MGPEELPPDPQLFDCAVAQAALAASFLRKEEGAAACQYVGPGGLCEVGISWNSEGFTMNGTEGPASFYDCRKFVADAVTRTSKN